MDYYIMRCSAHSGCVLCVILCFLGCIQMSCLCQGSPGKSFYCCKSIYSIVYNTFSAHLFVIYDSFLTLSFLLCIVIFVNILVYGPGQWVKVLAVIHYWVWVFFQRKREVLIIGYFLISLYLYRQSSFSPLIILELLYSSTLFHHIFLILFQP